MATPRPHVLRIGILAHAKIVEERLVRRQQPVSVGQSPKNTFYVPMGSLPASVSLFAVHKGRYQLILDERLRGTLSYGGSVASLEALQVHPNVHETAGVRYLPLPHSTRGKLVLGDITILFQFVPAVAPSPAPQLPAAARGGLGRSLAAEWSFIVTLIASLALQAGFVMLSVLFETPPDQLNRVNHYVEQLKVDVRLVDDEPEVVEPPQTTTQDPSPNDEPDSDRPADVADITADEVVPTVRTPTPPVRRPPPKRTAHSRTSARDSSTRRPNVKRAGILKHLNGRQDGRGGPDTLARTHSDKYADAFTGPDGGLTAENEHKGLGPRLSTRETAPRISGLDPSERGPNRLSRDVRANRDARRLVNERRETRTKARVRLTSLRNVGGLGRLDNAAVTRVFRRRASAFRSCYEARLKLKPNLSGKITLRFTIGTAGRITNIKVASNTTGDSALGSCISRKVKRWKFQSAEGGQKTFSYPIVLTKGR